MRSCGARHQCQLGPTAVFRGRWGVGWSTGLWRSRWCHRRPLGYREGWAHNLWEGHLRPKGHAHLDVEPSRRVHCFSLNVQFHELLWSDLLVEVFLDQPLLDEVDLQPAWPSCTLQDCDEDPSHEYQFDFSHAENNFRQSSPLLHTALRPMLALAVLEAQTKKIHPPILNSILFHLTLIRV